MALLIAADEAGYGPKLGPLVVAATVWQTDLEDREPCANQTPSAAFSALEQPLRVNERSVVQFADSKKLYRGGKKSAELDALELPLLGMLRTSGIFCGERRFSELLEKLAPQDSEQLKRHPWYQPLWDTATAADDQRPIDPWMWFPATERVRNLQSADWGKIEAWIQAARVRPLGTMARILDPREFNTGCERLGNKASLLSETTVALVRYCLEEYPEILNVEVFCDRHGGRKSYGSILQHHFPDSYPRILSEGPQQSRYELLVGSCKMHWTFSVGGDRFVPVAAASITAKYLRERLMECFNRYWQTAHDQRLRPTAGYPVDAVRFYREILPTIKRLELLETDILRDR